MGRDTYTRQWKRCGTHGGTLVENADQASSRDLLAEAMWRTDQTEDFDLLLSIHDEVIAEAPIGTATVHEFESMMAEVPWWAPGMPITAEGWVGPRLRK
jgi:DNA polymerase